ncbi:zinc finger protein ZFPM1 [Protopterus annectens]|uniref:zinc finger protein ZFPM1 n=1 Tax=Protopterus annectens TaxID=7888 RepID=UPI001CFC28F8|nr:zinc finger protein ZFPM1 [Protopterus annectens]
MSRRKQRNPRQIKRPFGSMEEGEESFGDDRSLSEREGGTSDLEGSEECDSSSPTYSEDPYSKEASDSPADSDSKETAEDSEELNTWKAPGAFELIHMAGKAKVRVKQCLSDASCWGPYKGEIQYNASNLKQGNTVPPFILDLEDEHCWLRILPLVSTEAEANCIIYSKGGEIWCKMTKAVSAGEDIIATLVAEKPRETAAAVNHMVKSEPEDSVYSATLPSMSDIQLLPQQAGMAAILATAVVNKDIFPCKDCGIWYRSERNLQAHLLYYCASRQKSSSPAAEEKPKDTSSSERVCSFPHCNKSCPSASSLEIHMRSHSGERPFICLICLSAFTTKANCERHLKVHTDTLNGVCHGCGFTSTTRDILYSHLVTNHMICQPGSKTEVYSPGSGLPTKPVTPGLSPVSASPNLRCTICGFLADSIIVLHQHTAEHTLRSSSTDLSQVQHQESTISPKGIENSSSAHLYDATDKKDMDAAVLINNCLADEVVVPLKIKEEPTESRSPMSEKEADLFLEPAGQPASDTGQSSGTSSPQCLPPVQIKTEVSSPTPGSSPVHAGASSVTPGGTVFLPQYLFGTEAAVVPQASEILAKMSELVHSRLKHGQSAVPLLYAGAQIPKGATCFECEITFNNIQNYFVHKRLYCSSRHLREESPPGMQKSRDSAMPAVSISSDVPSPPSATPSTSQDQIHKEDSTVDASIKITDIKEEDHTAKDTSSEAERASRESEDGQTPSSSTDELDDDPLKTVCDACNIRFSRHDTYIVHKRYYCASRHDIPFRRSCIGKTPFERQPVRTRKRRKLYEIHGAGNPSVLPLHNSPEVTCRSPQAASAQFEGVANAAEQLHVKRESSPVASKAENATIVAGFIPVTRTSTVPSPSSSPDGEGPIDLSKKPRIHGETLTPPLLPLTDYHECTSCRVSFNSVENYLAHKKYYCPATQLQQKTLEQLHKIKEPVLAVPKQQLSSVTDKPYVKRLESGKIKTEKYVAGSPTSVTSCTSPSQLPGTCESNINTVVDTPRIHANVKTVSLSANVTAAMHPFCPVNGNIKGDLREHYRNVQGLFVTKQASTFAVQGNVKDTAAQVRCQSVGISETNLPSHQISASPPQQGTRVRKDSLTSLDQREAASSPHVSSGSPVQNASPRPILTISPAPLNLSPVPEVLREAGLKSHIPLVYTDSSQTARSVPVVLSNGNTRYCRLCNIKFSSLSNFIAHKKYYCSSHAAEHVK